MKVYTIAILALFLVIFSVSVSAETYTLKDLNTNEKITDVISYVKIGEKSLVFPEAENIDLDLGEYDIVEIVADNPSTPGIDYYASFTLTDISGNVIYLTPTATLKGLVKDTLDNVVSGAELKCECNEIKVCPAKTDKFGSFNMNIIGVGHCKIFANYGSAMGYVSLDLEKGDLKDVEIKLDKTILKKLPSRGSLTSFGIVVIMIFAVLIFFTQYKLKKKTPKEKLVKKAEKKEEMKEEKVSRRSDDIMQTLGKKEKEIVSFLMSNNNQSYQAKIRHSLGMPRTSLARLLESLQRKRVITIQKEGKAIQIKLTSWFLGK
ncbi:MAG: hypothetical protein KAT43_00945 [Nanoarchaeota archaeon]|nr:hypothetical protein [Nanoarchaeota archaeon]